VVSPRLVIISVGEDNPFDHPSDEVTDRLEDRLTEENIYRTDEDGTIEFITDGKKLWVKVGR
jgi:competence protein ComEC